MAGVDVMKYERLQEMYAGEGYYWGKEPNSLTRRSLELLPEITDGLRAVDIGAGEGRDAVLFAAHGLETLAIDVAPNGLKKSARLAREKGVDLGVRQGDVNTLALSGAFDLIYSIGTVQYVRPANRRRVLVSFKSTPLPEASIRFSPSWKISNSHPPRTGALTNIYTPQENSRNTTRDGRSYTRAALRSTTTPAERPTNTPPKNTSSENPYKARSPENRAAYARVSLA